MLRHNLIFFLNSVYYVKKITDTFSTHEKHEVGIVSLLLLGVEGGGVRSLKLCMIVPVKLYIFICSGNLDACTRSHKSLKGDQSFFFVGLFRVV